MPILQTKIVPAVRGKDVHVAWTKVAGARGGYTVFRRRMDAYPREPHKPIGSSSDELYVDRNVPPGRYVYRIALAGKNKNEASAPVVVTMPVTVNQIPGAVLIGKTPGSVPAPTILPPVVQPLDLTVTAGVAGSATIIAETFGFPATYAIKSQPSAGVLSLAGGVLTYSQASPVSGVTATITVTARGVSTDQVVTLNAVAPAVNRPPVAGAINETVVAGQSVTINLPVVEPDGNAITAIQSVVAPASGTVMYDAFARTATYTSTASGTINWTYHASDGLLWSPPAQISVVVAAVNRPPASNNQNASTTQGRYVDIRPNVSDPDGNTFKVSIVTPPTRGTAFVMSTGLIRYTPNAGYIGADSIQYRATDSLGAVSNTATVTLNVAAVAPAPSGATVVSLGVNNTPEQNGIILRNAIRSTPAGGLIWVETYKTADPYLVDYVGELPPNLSYRSDGVADNQSVRIEFASLTQTEPAATLDVRGILFLSPKKIYVGVAGNPNGTGTLQDPVTYARAKTLAAGGWTQIVFMAGKHRGRNQVAWLSAALQRPARHTPIGLVDSPGVQVCGGEDVTGWTRLPGTNVWYASWTHDLFAPTGESHPLNPRLYKGYADPFGRAENFVWYDTTGASYALSYGHDFAEHIPAPNSLQPGTFVVDHDADRVYVRLHLDGDPNFVRVVGAVDQFAFRAEYTDGNTGKTHGTTYNNVYLSFRDVRHFATWPKANNAAVRSSNGWVLAGCGLRFCSGYGMAVGGNDTQIINPTIEWVGLTAIGNTIGRTGIGVADLNGRWWNYRGYAGFKTSDPNNLSGGQFELTCKFANTVDAVFLRWTGFDVAGPFLHLDINNFGFRIEYITCTRSLPTGVAYPKSIGDTCVVFIEVSPAAKGGRRGIIMHIRGVDGAGCVVKIGESQGIDISDVVAIRCRAAMVLRSSPSRKLVAGGGDPLFDTRDLNISGVQARDCTYGYEFTGEVGGWAGDDIFMKQSITIGGGTFDKLAAVYRYGGQNFTPVAMTLKFGTVVGVGDAIGAVN